MRMLAACVVALMLLAGCGTESDGGAEGANDGITEIHQKLSDGRTVTCLEWAGYRKGGLSCDWANAR